jgi:hypothetical protein
MFSWCTSLVDEYEQILQNNFQLLNIGLDTEHCHFLNIPKDKLLEFDMMNVGMMVARNGDYMLD